MRAEASVGRLGFWVSLALGVALSAVAAGCSGEIIVLNSDQNGRDGHAGDVPVAGAGGRTTPSACSGSPESCADDCDTDVYPYEQECVAGQWQCPTGTVNPYDCPPVRIDECCHVDTDCGDAGHSLCVNGVCKTRVRDACWTDSECPDRHKCKGAFVCPCLHDCDGPDQLGSCVPV